MQHIVHHITRGTGKPIRLQRDHVIYVDITWPIYHVMWKQPSGSSSDGKRQDRLLTSQSQEQILEK